MNLFVLSKIAEMIIYDELDFLTSRITSRSLGPHVVSSFYWVGQVFFRFSLIAFIMKMIIFLTDGLTDKWQDLLELLFVTKNNSEQKSGWERDISWLMNKTAITGMYISICSYVRNTSFKTHNLRKDD